MDDSNDIAEGEFCDYCAETIPTIDDQVDCYCGAALHDEHYFLHEAECPEMEDA